MSRKKKIGIVLLTFLIICSAGSIWYVNDYYRSTEEAEKYLQKDGDITITEIEDGLFLDGSGTEDALIFYPGAKVEYTAYVPMLYQLAEEGTDVFLVKMPCNLAIFGKDKADDILQEYSYKNWYLGGHSLGGAMAADYAADHIKDEKLSGLLLLAAYPTKSLKDSDMKVLTLYGTEDKVLHMDKVKEGRKYLPKTYKEVSIKGGNHAQFGCYGPQKGDGKAKISAKEQWKITAKRWKETVDKK